MSEKEVMRSLKSGSHFGDFKLLRLIARGGMGAVYEAIEIRLERKVALKVIAPPNPDEHDRDELVRRFMIEARTLAKVNHPNVVVIYSILTIEGIPVISMEYVEGTSFKELLREHRFTADNAVPLFIQMLEGLHCLHENKIIHRDLKPHNILVRPDGQVKILDFGIAKGADTGELTSVGVVVGSLPYMPPEIRVGVAASQRSDLWSVGAIFYECLVGVPLTKAMGETPNARDVVYPADCKVPAEMRKIISRLCAYRPIDRYETAVQAIEDLRRYQMAHPPAVSESLRFGKLVEKVARSRAKETNEEFSVETVTPVKAETMISTGRGDGSHVRPPKVRKRGRRLNPRDTSFLAAGILFVILMIIVLLPNGEKPRKASHPPVAPVQAAPEPPPSEPVTVPLPPPPPVQSEEALYLMLPTQDEFIWMDPGSIPTLTWSKSLNRDDYFVQIATDPAFRQLNVEEPAAGISFRPGHVLPEGTYYWRLAPRRAKLKPIGPHRFSIGTLAAIEPTRPGPAEEMEADAISKTATVHFFWECKNGVQRYNLQISNTSSFNRTADDQIVEDCKLENAQFAPGKYFWRVRMLDIAKAQTLWSKPRAFIVKAAPPAPKQAAVPVPVYTAPTPPAPVPMQRVRLAKPQISGKEQTVILSFKGTPRDIASIPNHIDSAPVVKWKPVKSASKYVVQFSKHKTFSPVISEEPTTFTALEWREAVPGKIYWRVSAMDESGEIGPHSERGVLNVLLPPPRIAPKYKFTIKPGDSEPPVFEWPETPVADKYIVQIGPTRELAQAQEQVTSMPKVSMSSGAGKYFARVALADNNGQPLSAFSKIAAIDVEASYALKKPKLLMPSSGVRAPAPTGRLSITFTWSRVDTADSYVLELSNDPDFAQPLKTVESAETKTTLKQVEVKGRVYWRVRAVNKQGGSDWSEPFYFEVR